MRAALAILLLSGGCYRLDALVSATGATIELAGSPVSKFLTSADPFFTLPLGLEQGDVVLAFYGLGFTAPATALPGWSLDEVGNASCGPHYAQQHRLVEPGESGATIDASGVIGQDSASVLIAAFRGVSGLGGSSDHVYSALNVSPPLTIDLPQASAGQLALLYLFADAGTEPTMVSNGGRQVIATNGNWLFSVPMGEAPPATISIDSNPTTCVVLRAQLLVP